MQKRNYTLIPEGSELRQETNQTYQIHQDAYHKLKALMLHSCTVFSRPHLTHFVIYLPEGEESISDTLEEFVRLIKHPEPRRKPAANSKQPMKAGIAHPAPLYRWCKEQKADHKHLFDGLHFHVQMILDQHLVYPHQRVSDRLTLLQERGHIRGWNLCPPITSGLGELKRSLKVPETAKELMYWVSYTCKQATKEGLTGRLYGGSQITNEASRTFHNKH